MVISAAGGVDHKMVLFSTLSLFSFLDSPLSWFFFFLFSLSWLFFFSFFAPRSQSLLKNILEAVLLHQKVELFLSTLLTLLGLMSDIEWVELYWSKVCALSFSCFCFWKEDTLPLAHVVVAYQGAPWLSPDSVSLQVLQTLLGCWDRFTGGGKNMSSKLAQVYITNIPIVVQELFCFIYKTYLCWFLNRLLQKKSWHILSCHSIQCTKTLDYLVFTLLQSQTHSTIYPIIWWKTLYVLV